MRLPLALFGLLLIAFTLPCTAQDDATPPPERWNVVWLTVEDMSPWLPCYGDDTVPTPHLDALAGASVRFTNAFATSPVCAPARSSLITACYATRIGTMHMRNGSPSRAAIAADPDAYRDIPSYQGLPPAFVRCFPETLRAAGYYCTNNSKTDYQFRAPATVWDASNNRAHYRDRAPGQPFFAVFNHGGTHESRAFPDNANAPVVVTPDDVPVPPLYPDTPAVREALARTYNNIARMDAWVGEHLAALGDAGLADSTIVVYFSDHGVGLPRGKRSPYDLGLRVPLLVRFPPGFPNAPAAGSTDDRVVSFVDLGPTTLSLVGIGPDDRLDGTPVLGPHARDRGPYAFAHADRFDSVYDGARTVTDGRFRYIRNHALDQPYLIANLYRRSLAITLELESMQGTTPDDPAHWQFAATHRPIEELYDSANDPWEIHNLAGDPAHLDKLAELRDALDAWIADTGDLGFVLPETRLVREHIWPPNGEQPTTAAPVITIADGRCTITCDTDGASIGYRLSDAGDDAPWSVYVEPFTVEPGTTVHALAHRIGWKPSAVMPESNHR